jgi:putative tricarboxylic transport membrane protein
MTTLVLGVPGSVTTGVLLGALTMHGLQAGPNFVAQQPELVYGIIAAAIVSQLMMVGAALLGAYSLSGTLSIPTKTLVPILLIFSIIGAYASRNSSFDVFLMLGFGALGYLMKRTGYSPAALVMGIILAPIADHELNRILHNNRDGWYWPFVSRPLAATILALLVGTLVWSLISTRRRRQLEKLLPDRAGK